MKRRGGKVTQWDRPGIVDNEFLILASALSNLTEYCMTHRLPERFHFCFLRIHDIAALNF